MTLFGERSALRRQLSTIAIAAFAVAAATWARAAMVGTLRVDDIPSAFHRLWPGLVLGIAFAAIAGAYARITQNAKAPTSSLLLGAIGLQLVAALALPLTSNDAFSNLAYGRLAVLGHNPYVASPDALGPGDPFASFVGSRWRDAPTVYGPIVTMVDKLAALPGQVGGGLLLLKLAMAAAVIGAIVIAYRLCKQFEPERGARSFAIFAFAPVVLWELSAQAHNDALMVLALVGFVVAAWNEREVLAVACLAFATYSKLAAAPVLVLYLVSLARQRFGRAAILAAGVVLLGVLLALPYLGEPGALRGPLSVLGGHAPHTSRSLIDLLYWSAEPLGLAAQRTVYRLCWLAGTGFLAFLGVRAMTRVRSFADVVHESLVIYLACCLVAAPAFQPWYVTWLLPLALVHGDARWQRLVAYYAALTPLQYVIPADPVTTLMIDVVIFRELWPLLRAPVEMPVTPPVGSSIEVEESAAGTLIAEG